MDEDENKDWIMVNCPYESYTIRFFWRLLKLAQWPYYLVIAKLKLRKISSLHEKLAGSQRVDLIPLKGSGRGFMIVLDNKEALYFYQDGDHFVYDGCEVGKYENGKVTIFDNIKDE